MLPCSALGPLEGKDTLSDMNKIELERFFWDGLHAYKSGHQRTRPDNLQRIGQSLYVSDNGWYETESIKNASFFKRAHFTYLPVCESALPVESAMTLLTGYTAKKQYSVHLLQHRYGFSKAETDVPLSQLLDYCMDSGCTPYVGIVSYEGDKVAASLFMVNVEQGYCHTFKFSIPKALLDSDEGEFSAEVYTYTPIHNLEQ